ncbi:unnamed protein product [Cuscuta campestris]|uniref:Uncharacterized protein n=1 Tax=Cuscuta campestris TaxID=132261 RepID=A0A484MTX4_9ASTE|nr:unnamed protein product [Cuscuta campestris]
MASRSAQWCDLDDNTNLDGDCSVHGRQQFHRDGGFRSFGRRPIVRGRNLDGRVWMLDLIHDCIRKRRGGFFCTAAIEAKTGTAAAIPLLLGGGGTWAVATGCVGAQTDQRL